MHIVTYLKIMLKNNFVTKRKSKMKYYFNKLIQSRAQYIMFSIYIYLIKNY